MSATIAFMNQISAKIDSGSLTAQKLDQLEIQLKKLPLSQDQDLLLKDKIAKARSRFLRIEQPASTKPIRSRASTIAPTSADKAAQVSRSKFFKGNRVEITPLSQVPFFQPKLTAKGAASGACLSVAAGTIGSLWCYSKNILSAGYNWAMGTAAESAACSPIFASIPTWALSGAQSSLYWAAIGLTLRAAWNWGRGSAFAAETYGLLENVTSDTINAFLTLPKKMATENQGKEIGVIAFFKQGGEEVPVVFTLKQVEKGKYVYDIVPKEPTIQAALKKALASFKTDQPVKFEMRLFKKAD